MAVKNTRKATSVREPKGNRPMSQRLADHERYARELVPVTYRVVRGTESVPTGSTVVELRHPSTLGGK